MEELNKKHLEKLYNSVSKDLDIGDFETYSKDMQTVEDRKGFYDVVSKELDLGDYDEYESILSGSVKSSVVSEPKKEEDGFWGNVASLMTQSAGKNSSFNTNNKQTLDFNKDINKETPEGKGFWDSYVGDAVENFGAGWIDVAAGLAKQSQFTQPLSSSARSGDAIASLFSGHKEADFTENKEAAGRMGDDLYEKADVLAKKANRYEGEDFVSLWNKGDVAGSIGELSLSTYRSLPSTLMAIASFAGGAPYAGLALTGNTTGQRDYYDLQKNPEAKDMSEMQKIGHASAIGTLEAITELLPTSYIVKGFKKVYSKVGVEAAEAAIKKGLMARITGNVKMVGGLLTPVTSEAFEEGVNQMGSNITDYVTGLTKELDITKNVGKASMYGGAGGAHFSGIMVPGVLRQATQNRAMIKQIKETYDPYLYEDGNLHTGKDLDGNDIFVVGETDDAYIAVNEQGVKRFVSKTEITDVTIKEPEDFASSILASRDLSKEDVVSTDKYTLPDGSVVTKVSEAIMEDGRIVVHDADGDPMFVDPSTLTPFDSSIEESLQTSDPVASVDGVTPQESIQEVAQEPIKLPRDKEGFVDYNKISDPIAIAQAAKEELGDDAVVGIRAMIKDQQAAFLPSLYSYHYF